MSITWRVQRLERLAAAAAACTSCRGLLEIVMPPPARNLEEVERLASLPLLPPCARCGMPRELRITPPARAAVTTPGR